MVKIWQRLLVGWKWMVYRLKFNGAPHKGINPTRLAQLESAVKRLWKIVFREGGFNAPAVRAIPAVGKTRIESQHFLLRPL